MYKENEELILLQDYGKEESDKFLPQGTIVTFMKAVDFEYKSFVQVSYGDRLFTLPELAVKPVVTDTVKVLKEFNSKLVENNPDLGRYHHNVIMRFYYKIKDFFKRLLTKKEKANNISESDLKDLKNFLNEGTEVEWFT